MLSEGWITEPKLRQALEAQRRSESGRIGEWMCRLGIATEQQVTSALGIQWSRPVFALEGRPASSELASFIPFSLLEAHQMVPVHYLPPSQHLYIAFSLGIDSSVLYGIEQMLACRTEPCLASRSAVRSALDQIRLSPRPKELVFDRDPDPKQMARIAANYISHLHSSQIRVVRCGHHLWLRLESGREATHLLFCDPSASLPPETPCTSS